MKSLYTEVLVIGGGATGTGILRDLALRGFKSILVEKRDLSHGTTGRYHGLLHSGGRYVVKDPQAARECIAENRILRKIMPQCLEDSGGFFVTTPWDEPEYAERFLEGCHSTGIPVEEIPIKQMLREEPLLNPDIQRCFRVPDAAADSFLASELNVLAARGSGAQALTYHEVLNLLQDGNRVVGALCRDLVKDEQVEIHAEIIVNAAGAWVGKLAATAGVKVRILPGKGTMLAINQRIVNTVINRCKMPADGDILVPIHTVAVIGTTDEQVPDPDRFAIEPWEIRLMLKEGEKLIPGFSDMRVLRAWAGVRPLYQETGSQASRDISRAFVLLDHEQRDGTPGLVTITSGKWTTYRLMAEATVDLVCMKLATQRPCRTHLEALPGLEHTGYHYLGARLADVENQAGYGDLICECELATREDVVKAITTGQARTIDDIRREARLGMGPCQGGFCTYRVAGLLHDIRQAPVDEINVSLRDFLQERWKGLLPVLWGQQLRQERLDELIYLSLLNCDHLTGPESSRLASEAYAPPQADGTKATVHRIVRKSPEGVSGSNVQTTYQGQKVDVLVIGAGLAGLVAAWRAATTGASVRLVAKGWGATHWHAGCIDVLGYYPTSTESPVTNPLAVLAQLSKDQPRHPYSQIGIERLAQALEAFKTLCAQSGYPLRGSLERNWLLPSAMGSPRPTCLAPDTMVAGDLQRNDPMLVVGFEQLQDFTPGLVAANLAARDILARAAVLDLHSLRQRRFVYPTTLATMFESEDFQSEVVAALKPKLGRAARVGFPAVLGLQDAPRIVSALRDRLGCDVFEIPILPPSIPGIRLHNLLVSAIENAGGRVYDGMEILSADHQDGKISNLWSEAAARRKPHHASSFILATGGLLGGGLVGTSEGEILETIFELPLDTPTAHSRWFNRDFFDPAGHPVFRTGVFVNAAFQPIDEQGQVVFTNLLAAGAALAGFEPIRERSYEGVAIATGFYAGEKAAIL